MKNLGKIKAIIISSVIVLVMAFGLVLSFVPMSFSKKDFESFGGAMKKATTIDAGMSVEYEIKGNYEDETVADSIKILTDIIGEYGLGSVNAYKKGDNKIRVDLSKPVLYSDRSSAEDFLESLATGKLEFKNKNDAKATLTPPEGETVDPTLIVIDATKHIEKVEKISNGQVSGLRIDFNKEGKSLYSSSVGSELYMFVGGKAWPSAQNNELSANTDPSAVSMYLMFNSSEAVDSYYYTIRAGMMAVELDSENVDIVYNSSKSAVAFNVAGIVLSVVVFLGLMILLLVKFKGFAIATIISSLVFLSLELFLMQAMNWVVFGFTGFIAFAAMALLYYILNAQVYSTIHSELKIGKSLTTATDDAYKKNLWVIVDTTAITLIVGLVLSFLATGEMVAVGTILALSSVLMAVGMLLFNRLIHSCVFSIFSEKLFRQTRGEEE